MNMSRKQLGVERFDKALEDNLEGDSGAELVTTVSRLK